MNDINYDNERICSKCGGQNDYKVVESINLHPCETETHCTECGWKDYWSYGWYDSRVDESYDKYVEEVNKK